MQVASRKPSPRRQAPGVGELRKVRARQREEDQKLMHKEKERANEDACAHVNSEASTEQGRQTH